MNVLANIINLSSKKRGGAEGVLYASKPVNVYHRVQNEDMRAFVGKKEQGVLENEHCQN
jgi:hypothetical protein